MYVWKLSLQWKLSALINAGRDIATGHAVLFIVDYVSLDYKDHVATDCSVV